MCIYAYFILSGCSNVRVLTRKHIFDLILEQRFPDFNKKVDAVESQFLTSDKFNEDEIRDIKRNFSHLKTQLKKRWKAACYIKNRFISKNHDWLQGTFVLPKAASTIHKGRPSKSFEDSSERSKRRKTEALREVDLKTLTHATGSKMYKEGKRVASQVLKDFESSPKRASKYKKAFIKKEDAKKLSPFQALKMIVEADLTRNQYELIRATNKHLYPCYSLIQKAKEVCFPDKEDYRITETCAEVKLEALVLLTNKRLVLSLFEVLNTLTDNEKQDLTLISKWGCDGSQQAQFKQKFSNEADSDKQIFQSSFVPLRIIVSTTKKVVWENPTPSSPRLCRPIRIRFLKETTDVTNEEIAYVTSCIAGLQPLRVNIDDSSFLIKQCFLLTMVDGKICNAATDTKSTLRCYICKQTSSQFNNLTEEKIENMESLNFGLSVLHARIRIFESLLHLAYKLPLQKGRISKKNATDSKVLEDTKKKIQDDFKLRLGLLVDIPKAGFGNTNDGNTSRRFFEDPDVASEITGINKKLIYRLKVILEAISSGMDINPKKYNEYALDTAKLYVKLYSWCPMTPTLHKVLVHGASIIKNALLPIGQLSEEAAEARNKHFKLYRQNFARKFSREDCNLDVFNRLLLTSDPVISLARPKRKRKGKPFLPETIALFKSVNETEEDSSSEEEDQDV